MTVWTFISCIITGVFCAMDTIAFLYPESESIAVMFYGIIHMGKDMCEKIIQEGVNGLNNKVVTEEKLSDEEKTNKRKVNEEELKITYNRNDKDLREIDVGVSKSIRWSTLYFTISPYILLIGVFFFKGILSNICILIAWMHIFRDFEYRKKGYIVDTKTIRKWALGTNFSVIVFMILSYIASVA